MANASVRRLARHTARSVGRRLASAASRELARRGHPPAHPAHDSAEARAPARGFGESSAPARGVAEAFDLPEASQPRADDAELDFLRVELVSELDRLAMQDPDCTGSFRRI